MLKASAIEHYGSQTKLAAALNISRAAIGQWGALVPPLRAMQLHELTGGALRYEPDAYSNWFDKFGRGSTSTDGRAA